MFGGRQMSEEEKAAARSAAVNSWRASSAAWHTAVNAADLAHTDSEGAMRDLRQALNSSIGSMARWPQTRRAKFTADAAEAAWTKAVEAIDAAVAATDAASIAVAKAFETRVQNKPAEDGAEVPKPDA